MNLDEAFPILDIHDDYKNNVDNENIYKDKYDYLLKDILDNYEKLNLNNVDKKLITKQLLKVIEEKEAIILNFNNNGLYYNKDISPMTLMKKNPENYPKNAIANAIYVIDQVKYEFDLDYFINNETLNPNKKILSENE
jgi:hypothetical protein